MKVWIYCQEPEQLHTGAVTDAWRAVAAGYLVQLHSPDLWPQPDFEPDWQEWISASCQSAQAGARELPWMAVTQVANRQRPGRNKVLLPWDDDGDWARYFARVTRYTGQAAMRNAAGIVLDEEDYGWRYQGDDRGWAGPRDAVKAAGAIWRLAANRLPVSILDHCSTSWWSGAWKTWSRELLRNPKAQPCLVWQEDTFFHPNQVQLAAVRIGLRASVGTDRVGVGLKGDPVRMSVHPLAKLAEKRGLPVWVYPWK